MKPVGRILSNQEIKQIFENRYSCKSYDSTRQVSKADLETILEVGRLSPSSMGLEPWHFLVLSPGKVIDKLLPYCWGVHPTPSHYLFLLGRNYQQFKLGSEYVAKIHNQVQKRDPASLTDRYQIIDRFHHTDLGFKNDELEINAWVDRQVYIAMGNILTACAMMGIDSTPIEGMTYKNVEKVLIDEELLDPDLFHLTGLITLGYTDREDHRPKTRRSLAEVSTISNK